MGVGFGVCPGCVWSGQLGLVGYWRYSWIAVEVMYYKILYTCRGLELRHRVQSGYDCSCAPAQRQSRSLKWRWASGMVVCFGQYDWKYLGARVEIGLLFSS